MNYIFKGLFTATALASMLATGAVADEPKKGGTLITVLGSNVRNLNSAVQSLIFARQIIRKIIRFFA